MQTAQGMDWGSVPAWFSAILSGGSVLLALYIILRDRKKAEREDATKVLVWTETGDDGETETTYVFNASPRTVHAVTLLLWRNGASFRDDPELEKVSVAPTLRPDEEASKTTTAPTLAERGRQPRPWAVGFIDADGGSWVRELGTLRLKEQRPYVVGILTRTVGQWWVPKNWRTSWKWRYLRRHGWGGQDF